ncbi:hypothetical protein Q5P01_025010 [Channa striata]|uniref:C-type lectin domain-containing protein n=1 Tax=Channa striata TaxID=64152 RepID=A0AA88J1D9_CHASR|nr:hypothetical protein Q5P01_025010 [Channa striata]
MSEDIYAKPDLTKKFRIQKSENDDKHTAVYDDTDNSANKDNSVIYDNCWVEGRTPPKLQDSSTEDQQQIVAVNVNSHKWNLVKVGAVFLVLLLLLLAAVIVIIIQNTTLNTTRNERDQLQTNFTNLSREKHQLQTNYSQVQSLQTNLTQRTKQLEDVRDFLMVVNSNLTQQRDKLKQQLETPCCPDKWTKFGNSCLWLSNSNKSWSDSKQSCENLGARLVIINTQEKQDFISTLVQRAWIGLTDQQNSKVWKWVDGTQVNKTFWGKDEPNSMGDEHCVEIYNSNSNPNNWNDLNCNYQLYFVCEKIMQ